MLWTSDAPLPHQYRHHLQDGVVGGGHGFADPGLVVGLEGAGLPFVACVFLAAALVVAAGESVDEGVEAAGTQALEAVECLVEAGLEVFAVFVAGAVEGFALHGVGGEGEARIVAAHLDEEALESTRVTRRMAHGSRCGHRGRSCAAPSVASTSLAAEARRRGRRFRAR
ncbi:MAG: hypothetical protein EA398_01170 [Deltaproteobacteria bacterium]|nr:MAG: hypothetical protein EA398_01170 [Deltaproteobacteria bacterium]